MPDHLVAAKLVQKSASSRFNYRKGLPIVPVDTPNQPCLTPIMTVIGDYLVVLPYNNQDTVRRVLAKFQLHPDDRINISGTRKSFLVSMRAETGSSD